MDVILKYHCLTYHHTFQHFNIFNKSCVSSRVRGKIIPKRINIRIEHVNHSKCRQDFLERVKQNEKLRREAKQKNIKVELKRQPAQPRPAHIVSGSEGAVRLAPIPYEFIA